MEFKGKVEKFGRITLPCAVRDRLELKENDILSISLIDKHIIIYKKENY